MCYHLKKHILKKKNLTGVNTFLIFPFVILLTLDVQRCSVTGAKMPTTDGESQRYSERSRSSAYIQACTDSFYSWKQK